MVLVDSSVWIDYFNGKSICLLLDGVFEGGPDGQVRFRPAQALTAEALAAIATQNRRRVLRWFARSGLLEAVDAQDLLTWDHGGFSLDAVVRIDRHDRAGVLGTPGAVPDRPTQPKTACPVS